MWCPCCLFPQLSCLASSYLSEPAYRSATSIAGNTFWLKHTWFPPRGSFNRASMQTKVLQRMKILQEAKIGQPLKLLFCIKLLPFMWINQILCVPKTYSVSGTEKVRADSFQSKVAFVSSNLLRFYVDRRNFVLSTSYIYWNSIIGDWWIHTLDHRLCSGFQLDQFFVKLALEALCHVLLLKRYEVHLYGQISRLQAITAFEDVCNVKSYHCSSTEYYLWSKLDTIL